MQYRADSLGLSGSVTTIFRDLIHEHLGLMYEPHQFDQVADRLAPLVLARGLGSFMDYYYVLKYAVGRRRVAQGHGRARRPGDLFLAGDRSAPRRRDVGRARARQCAEGQTLAAVERAVRHGRGTAHPGDVAHRSGLVRPRSHRAPGERCQPARDRTRAEGAVHPAILSQSPARPAGEVLRASTRVTGASILLSSSACRTTSST